MMKSSTLLLKISQMVNVKDRDRKTEKGERDDRDDREKEDRKRK